MTPDEEITQLRRRITELEAHQKSEDRQLADQGARLDQLSQRISAVAIQVTRHRRTP